MPGWGQILASSVACPVLAAAGLSHASPFWACFLMNKMKRFGYDDLQDSYHLCGKEPLMSWTQASTFCLFETGSQVAQATLKLTR